MSDHTEKIKALLASGWKFKFDPQTKYICMYHKKGGQKSICEMALYEKEELQLFGHVITDYLNSLER